MDPHLMSTFLGKAWDAHGRQLIAQLCRLCLHPRMLQQQCLQRPGGQQHRWMQGKNSNVVIVP